MCDSNLLTFDKDGSSQLLEGLNFAQFTLNNCKWERLLTERVLI